ncbi:hypothetical protein PABG_11512 [Paracoccidioides brasiliensis Pb03]|nr:hypothetical protein PABG_11512 [Paracoccidioides brasiliensis Pb03]
METVSPLFYSHIGTGRILPLGLWGCGEIVVVDPSAAEAGVTSSGRGVELGHIQAAESCQSVAEYCKSRT